MMKSNLGPAAQAMVQNFGIKLDILDVGWRAIAAVTWSSPIIAILIFCILATNIVMLVLKGHRYPGCGYLELSSHGNCRNHGLFCD